MDPVEARALAIRLLGAGLRAVDPGAAVDRFFADHPAQEAAVRSTAGALWVVGAGKASAPMVRAIQRRFGEQIAGGVVILREPPNDAMTRESGADTDPLRIVIGGHPILDAPGVAASREIAALASSLGPTDRLLVLLSGGASSLLWAPPPGLSLRDLQITSSLLLASGAPIEAINAVRKCLCRLKAGGLAALAHPAPVLALVVSDVIGDDLSTIGSGPTIAERPDFEGAVATLERFGVFERLPAAVREHLRAGSRGDRPALRSPEDPRLRSSSTFLVVRAQEAATAMTTAARELGLEAEVHTTALEGEAREVGVALAKLARQLSEGGSLRGPRAALLAGETTVTLGPGPVGQGGRNQECALSAALELDGLPRTLIACFASDGSDGPTDAAGAIVDSGTCARARACGLDPHRALSSHDAYPLLAATGDLVKTGPTETNVADLALVLAW